MMYYLLFYDEKWVFESIFFKIMKTPQNDTVTMETGLYR